MAKKKYNILLKKEGSIKSDQSYKEFKVSQLRIDKKIDFTSGRKDDWLEIINKFEKNKILLGYGAQADRFLINQSASNGLIYSFSSSGIVGFIFYIIFSNNFYFINQKFNFLL